MLVDKLRIDFIAGKGGDGLASFAKFGRSLGKNGKMYYPKKGKPDGGDGGKGGDIYLEGSRDIYDLSGFTSKNIYAADDGEKGLPNHKQGKSGRDRIIKVPLVTLVTDTQGNTKVKITKHGEKKRLVQGGEGGIGNYFFREGQLATLNKTTPGKEGQTLKGFIELRLAADIVFIGFPNAGKSSMLNALTNANVKVASYPFTTIQPQLGVMQYGIKLMDLPGLIEGVSEGKGLGKSFNKHTAYASFIAHFISLESEDVVRDYLSIRHELEAFSEALAKKPEMIILTKSDTQTEEQIAKKKDLLAAYNNDIMITSVYDAKSIAQMTAFFSTHMQSMQQE